MLICKDKHVIRIGWTSVWVACVRTSNLLEVFIVELKVEVDAEVVFLEHAHVRLVLARTQSAQRSRVSLAVRVAPAKTKLYMYITLSKLENVKKITNIITTSIHPWDKT